MSKQFYLRFGLHRDRKMFRLLKDDYAGIVVPAHILAYSSNATIAALRYIEQPYFIDPMTYIYGKGFLDDFKVFKKDDEKKHLKPSIVKLTSDLSLAEKFPEIGAKPLELEDFTDEFIEKLAKGSLDIQMNKINKGLASSTPKLDQLLEEIGKPPSSSTAFELPQFITAPYFLIPTEDSSKWLDVNLKLAQETRKKAPADKEVWPIVLTYVDLLKESLLDKYKGFPGLVVWIEDLDESKLSTHKEQVRKLKAYKAFVEKAKTKNIKIINLYGSYYSAILLKLGLEAFCNGPLYGEYKSSASSLGGVPPVRVYMPSLHRFYIYSQASELLRLHPELFESFPDSSKELFKSIPELAKILGDVTLAQEHFINCRNDEIKNVGSSSLEDLRNDLKTAYESVGPFEVKTLQNKEPHQLKAWRDALKPEAE